MDKDISGIEQEMYGWRFMNRLGFRFAFPFVIALLGPMHVQAQLKIDEGRIFLNLYRPTAVDTTVELGKYQLAIGHEADISSFSLWKNGRQVRRLKMHDNKPNTLYKGVRTRLIKPILHFRRATEYIIRIRLEGAGDELVFKLMTRPADWPEPLRNELGTPVIN